MAQQIGGRLIGKIISNIENELEELKDVLSENEMEFEEMPSQTRSERGQARAARRNKDGSPDLRYKENRGDGSTTGQGEVKHPESDRRLKQNR